MVINSGFTIVRETDTPTATGSPLTNKKANEELFLKLTTTMAKIDGDGGTPTNIVTVDHNLGVPFVVGAIITIADVGGLTDFNKDVGVVITEIVSSTKFKYETTKHSESGSITGSFTIRILDPYVLTEEDISSTLQTFVHLSTSNTILSTLEVTRNNKDYAVLANDEKLVGDVFRTITMKLGDSFNARFQDKNNVLSATLAQEN